MVYIILNSFLLIIRTLKKNKNTNLIDKEIINSYVYKRREMKDKFLNVTY